MIAEKKTFISELKSGQKVDSVFYAKNVQQRAKTNGEPFLTMELQDKTGSVSATMWEGFDTLDQGTLQFVRVAGAVGIYREKLQLTINTILPVAAEQVTLSDFIPATAKDVEELFAYASAKIEQMKNAPLRLLLQTIFGSPETAARFKNAPAAKSLHNAYLGGLIEHVVDLLHLADFICEYYEGIDKDLLMAGVLLHDLGKIDELAMTPAIEYTDEGKLLGHSLLVMEVLDTASRAIPNFPRDLLVQLKHLILTHHGRPEWGSPKSPMTMEAVALHYLDNLDAKIRGFQQFVEKDSSTGAWTSRSFLFDNTELYKKKLL